MRFGSIEQILHIRRRFEFGTHAGLDVPKSRSFIAGKKFQRHSSPSQSTSTTRFRPALRSGWRRRSTWSDDTEESGLCCPANSQTVVQSLCVSTKSKCQQARLEIADEEKRSGEKRLVFVDGHRSSQIDNIKIIWNSSGCGHSESLARLSDSQFRSGGRPVEESHANQSCRGARRTSHVPSDGRHQKRQGTTTVG